MMKSIMAKALATAALMAFTTVAQAQEKVIWWDFLGGGDGVRMKSLIADFNKENAGKVEIQATTLDWGVPFYTKVQTSVAVGEGPDVMTYHSSRIPLAVEQGILQEVTADDMKAMGLSKDSFAPAIWDGMQSGGKQYAVPLDTHPIVLYYNKDKLAAAGLIGENGLPSGLNGVDNFNAALKKLQDGGTKWGDVDLHRRRRFPVPHDLFPALPARRADADRRGVARRRQQGQADPGFDGRIQLGEGRPCARLHRISCGDRAVHVG